MYESALEPFPRHPSPCTDDTGPRADWSRNPMNSSTLGLFTDAHILRQAGRALLTEFFEHFTHLLPYKHFLPSPRADNEEYFDCLAAVLECTGDLPTGLAEALIEVEALAALESRRGGPAALGDDSPDAESPSLSEAIRGWLCSHGAETLSSAGGEQEQEQEQEMNRSDTAEAASRAEG